MEFIFGSQDSALVILDLAQYLTAAFSQAFFEHKHKFFKTGVQSKVNRLHLQYYCKNQW